MPVAWPSSVLPCVWGQWEGGGESGSLGLPQGNMASAPAGGHQPSLTPSTLPGPVRTAWLALAFTAQGQAGK